MKRLGNGFVRSVIIASTLAIVFSATVFCVYADSAYYAESVDSALDKAGGNAGELKNALESVEGEQREGMLFLIANMPQRDLESLSSDFLLNNVRYAYRAWNEAPWKDSISVDMFLENILPYANVNERRDDWREDFYNEFKPLVADCKTPAEAAVRLNQKIFNLLDVAFSRRRPKADQGPYETIEANMASCSGLSILLVDACRAVGVPARFAGIPLWPDKSGNHSWVEIWAGRWYHTGAAEPNGDQLDKAWFTAKARTADAAHPLHSIYAVSFKKTNLHFPLAWARDVDYVPAVNVTERYKSDPGMTEDEAAASTDERKFDVEASLHAVRQLQDYLRQPSAAREDVAGMPFAGVALSGSDAQKAALMLWSDHAARLRSRRSEEMERRKLTMDGMEMPFYYSVNGDKPARGRSLFISLHGGGGAPKAVNDGQWENQKRLYQIEEGVYIAPRAPNDAWNMWFQGHIDGMFDRLIENMIVFEDVNPNRVYLMGYSAGGDGIYRMGPRMADRWAAAAMMAGHPGDASPVSLYNTPFTIHVGENDGAYNRNEEARKWGERLDKLSDENPGGYTHWTKIYTGRGHWVDNGAASAIPWMRKHTRDPLPKTVVWRQDKHRRFYWLATDALRPGSIVRARIDGQRIDIDAEGAGRMSIRLNDRMVNLDKEISVGRAGKLLYRGRPDRTIATIAKTIAERGDPASIFSSEILLDLD